MQIIVLQQVSDPGQTRNWVTVYEDLHGTKLKDTPQKYTASLYFAVITVATIGYGLALLVWHDPSKFVYTLNRLICIQLLHVVVLEIWKKSPNAANNWFHMHHQDKTVTSTYLRSTSEPVIAHDYHRHLVQTLSLKCR